MLALPTLPRAPSLWSMAIPTAGRDSTHIVSLPFEIEGKESFAPRFPANGGGVPFGPWMRTPGNVLVPCHGGQRNLFAPPGTSGGERVPSGLDGDDTEKHFAPKIAPF